MLDIRIDGLHKEFDRGRVVAVKELDVTFPAGTTTCLLGPSGCGKTTLMRMIAGLEKPTRGDIYFGDERVTRLSTRRRNIGMVFQYPVAYRGITVRENIELPLRGEGLDANERRRRADEVMALLEMGDSAERDVGTLDNGTRQKVAVARAVARQPRIILFDEPITNVDINAKLQLKRALKELVTRLNQTIVYVTHDQTEAMTLADRIALMRDGEIVQYDAPRTLYNEPDDVFGGWFLGNPGMNFFENMFTTNGAKSAGEDGWVKLPIFNRLVRVDVEGNASSAGITLGIRPEHVRVYAGPTGGAVRTSVLDKVIVTGGQFLLTLQFGGQTIKAKLPASMGRAIGDEAWVELPIERVRLFDSDGHRPHATLIMQ